MNFTVNNLLWANEQSFSSVLNMLVNSVVVMLSLKDASEVAPNGGTVTGTGVYYEGDLLFILETHRITNDKYKAITIIRDCLSKREGRVFTRTQVEPLIAFDQESYDSLVAQQLRSMESVHA